MRNYYIEESFEIGDFYLIFCDILTKPQLVKAESRQEAEDIFNEYWENDIDYMCRGRENISGCKRANIKEVAEYLSDGYLVKVER